jgi:cbb3-type cytochrome oxidase maturation protein
MSVIILLLALALLLAAVAVTAFAAAAGQGQFDDLDTPGIRVLTEDAQSPAHPARVDLFEESHKVADPAR